MTNLDNKEFLAVKASDVVKAHNKIMKIFDEDIRAFRLSQFSKNEKFNNEEIESFTGDDSIQNFADHLESLRESVQEVLWIDQLGDEPE